MKIKEILNKPGFIFITGLPLGFFLLVLFHRVIGLDKCKTVLFSWLILIAIYNPILVERIYLNNDEKIIKSLPRIIITILTGIIFYFLWILFNQNSLKELSQFNDFRDFTPIGIKFTAIVVLLGSYVSYFEIKFISRIFYGEKRKK